MSTSPISRFSRYDQNRIMHSEYFWVHSAGLRCKIASVLFSSRSWWKKTVTLIAKAMMLHCTRSGSAKDNEGSSWAAYRWKATTTRDGQRCICSKCSTSGNKATAICSIKSWIWDELRECYRVMPLTPVMDIVHLSICISICTIFERDMMVTLLTLRQLILFPEYPSNEQWECRYKEVKLKGFSMFNVCQCRLTLLWGLLIEPNWFVYKGRAVK